MPIDARGRRLPFERTPKDDAFTLTERDLALFEAIHRHGPLSSNYLFEFARRFNGSELHLKHRLTKLFHGLNDGTYFLERPPQQYQSLLARAQHSIYDLAPAAKILLSEAGRLSPYVPERTDHFLHRFMAACVSSSIELTCRKAGIRYIHRHEIFSHERCPERTRRASNPLSIPASGTCLIPDDLFGLDYGGKYRFFAVEIDRNTESIERRSLVQSAFARKIKGYLDILESRAFREVWGVPALLVLVVTTNATHMANIVRHVRDTGSPHAEKFLFQAKPEFGINWKIPSVLNGLLTGPWMRTGTEFDISKL